MRCYLSGRFLPPFRRREPDFRKTRPPYRRRGWFQDYEILGDLGGGFIASFAAEPPENKEDILKQLSKAKMHAQDLGAPALKNQTGRNLPKGAANGNSQSKGRISSSKQTNTSKSRNVQNKGRSTKKGKAG